MDTPRFKPVADTALLIEFGDRIDNRLNRLVIALDKAIATNAIEGVVETVPALVNCLVVFDPLVTDHAGVEAAVRRLMPISETAIAPARTHVVEVCYDPDLGPDLSAVSAATGLSVDAVIDHHLNSEMVVSMYGFAPGYAYLTGLSDAIRVPRKTTAVRDVPKGSVIIAGPQCLVTTLTMPTGWSIIGRSPTQVMQDDADGPFLFDVGDKIVFQRIERQALPSEIQSA